MLYSFDEYELDLQRYELRYAGKRVKLEPQVFNILVYLIEHRERVVTKEELLEQLWQGRVVGEAALTSRLTAARKVIGDSGREQRLIQTVHGRGYRFMAPVTVADGPPAVPAVSSPPSRFAAAPSARPPPGPPLCGLMVGRDGELAQLDQHFDHALRGARQVVLITGEARIGKTTLVDVFVAQVAATTAVWIGRGQCIEQHGAGEAYLPLLEALGRLGRGPDGSRLLELLRQQAPSWLVHLPALVPPAEVETVQRRTGGATRERMLRELTEAVEALTAACPLVLVLEDLHWSDVSTLDWLAYVARRREPARLLVVGTSRPIEAAGSAHPLRAVTQELRLHSQGVELVLPYLPETGVAAYLAQRYGAGTLPAALARVLHQRTGGNPLFLVAVLDTLVQQGRLQEGPTGWALVGDLETVTMGVPASVRQLLEQQFEQLAPEEQVVLEAASVVGVEFTAAAVATVALAIEGVEACCDALARRGQFVQARGTADWPDGTVTARYGFRHALYRELVYDRVPASRRVRWHRQIGARLEAGYGARAPELAAELAEHFVRGRHAEQAVPYLQLAGAQAVQRSAHREALQHLTRGLELLAMLPETPARAQRELDLQIALGLVLIDTKGRGAPEVEQTYARARALCQQVGDTPQLFSTLQGLCGFYRSRGALPTARELGEQLYQLALREADPTHRLEAHGALGGIVFYLGDYAAARTYLEQGITLIDPTAQWALALRANVTTGLTWCLVHVALTLWCLGYPAQALRRSQEALALAQALAHPYSLGLARHYAATLHHHRREAPAVQAQVEALLTLATAQGFPLWAGFGTCWRGWALAMRGQSAAGLAQLHQGMTAILATGQELGRPFCLVLLAEAAGQVGQVDEGLRLLAQALMAMEESRRGDLLAEAYRLRGELLLRQAVPEAVQAEACFQQALDIARRQQAKSWELRAAVSLARLWRQQGKRAEARELLAPIYGWFAEGFDTADLRDAKALLEELA
jgi:DNA-binding winged helix-turn-helix (wHTH) protein/predicted ATPase